MFWLARNPRGWYDNQTKNLGGKDKVLARVHRTKMWTIGENKGNHKPLDSTSSKHATSCMKNIENKLSSFKISNTYVLQL